MILTLKQAIRQLTLLLGDHDNDNIQKRADDATEACIIIEKTMGLDFAENLLTEQLNAIKPNRGFIGFANIFGLALYRKVHYDLAIICFLYRIERNPRDKIAYNNLGLTYNRLGRSRDAAHAYRKGLDADPDYKQAGSNLLYLQHYIWGARPGKIAADHRAYAERHYQTTSNRMRGRRINSDPDRKLKIGFISGDFRFHAVSRFIEGIFAKLDRSQFEVFVYHTYSGPEDTISATLKSYAVKWKRVHKLELNALIELIQDNGIDMLFDLAVYTQGGNPDLMAQQVAPVQINYMGYPDTSGIPAINYRITDVVSDPPGVDRFYSEKLTRLPVPMWNYSPWPNLPEPPPPPCFDNGFITFGSMNNHAKLQAEWMEVWARVLHAVPDSVLLLKSRAMNSERTGPAVIEQFSEWGIPSDRIKPRGFDNRPNDHFLTFHDIDIAFDSIPYNGTTTTFDSLWMGVPVVTMTGDLHVSRTSASILAHMNLEDWIAHSAEEFVDICRSKASDRESLRTLRHQMRQTMSATSLGNAGIFCRHFEKALLAIWREYCATHNQTADVPHQSADEEIAIPQATSRTAAATEPVNGIVRHDAQYPPLVSVVVCTAGEHALDNYRRHIEKTIGAPYEFIGVDNAENRYSLSEAYNLGGNLAKSDVIVFVHDDVFFATPDWGQILLQKFSANPDLGLIGLAGTAYLQSRYPYWVASKAPFIHGRVIHHGNRMKLSHYSSETSDQTVVAIDGLMMAARRTAFLNNPFDQDVFDGFHLYDLDFSARISGSYEVIVTHDILVKHLSGGSFDEAWKKYRDRFRRKYPSGIWTCQPGKPAEDAHKQRLNCHQPLEEVFGGEQLHRLAQLGDHHPKHPDYNSTNSRSQTGSG